MDNDRYALGDKLNRRVRHRIKHRVIINIMEIIMPFLCLPILKQTIDMFLKNTQVNITS